MKKIVALLTFLLLITGNCNTNGLESFSSEDDADVAQVGHFHTVPLMKAPGRNIVAIISPLEKNVSPQPTTCYRRGAITPVSLEIVVLSDS
jgi:hypothetical protein